MEKANTSSNDASRGSQNPSASPESRKESIQKCIRAMVHACQCRDANCRQPSCQKMKRVVSHTKQCKRKTNGGCPICKQLIALCCYHAKNCQDSKCPVPFCANIKHKLKQQQLAQRIQQAQLLRRRLVFRAASTGGPNMPLNQKIMKLPQSNHSQFLRHFVMNAQKTFFAGGGKQNNLKRMGFAMNMHGVQNAPNPYSARLLEMLNAPVSASPTLSLIQRAINLQFNPQPNISQVGNQLQSMQIDDAEKINDSKATYDLQNPSTSNAANQAWPSMGPHPDIHEAQTKQVLVDLNTKQGKNEEATKQRMWQQLLQPEQQQSDATESIQENEMTSASQENAGEPSQQAEPAEQRQAPTAMTKEEFQLLMEKFEKCTDPLEKGEMAKILNLYPELMNACIQDNMKTKF